MFQPAPAVSPELAQRAVQTIKFLSVDGVEKANSGHPGLPMGAADLAFVLFSRYLKHNPADPKWLDRDRFVLSAGHGSMLIYSMLHLSGYALSLDDLKNFRQWDSLTPGHPESHITPGVECTTGPLGQGFATAIGMAFAGKLAEARLPGLFSHNIWAIVSDGDIMEGITHEAASLASHMKLGNLKFIYDDNKITLDGKLSESMSEDVAARFRAYGWHTISIDGHNHEQIAAAYDEALQETERPVLILARTVIGKGAPNKQDSHKVHGEPLGAKELEAAKKAADWPTETPFFIPEEVRALFQARAADLAEEQRAWQQKEAAWCEANPEAATLYRQLQGLAFPSDLLAQLAEAAPTATDATRSLAGAVLQKAAALVPSLVGGDADLGGSTKTVIAGSAKILPGEFGGKNIRFGIREHAMGAMANGIALYGLFIPYTATFLTFSDYMRPAIRLAALSELPVVHVFTHDSIFLGEDGPTHQPVEHTASLRLIPNVDVWRPGTSLECAVAWGMAIQRRNGPSELILSRQKVDAAPRAVAPEEAAKGGYVLVRESGAAPALTIVATGSELGFAVSAAEKLTAEGHSVRVVSMPCLELFERQSIEYQDSVLGAVGKRAVIEAGRSTTWKGLVGRDGLVIGIDSFGASAPYKVLVEKFGFNTEAITAKLKTLL